MSLKDAVESGLRADEGMHGACDAEIARLQADLEAAHKEREVAQSSHRRAEETMKTAEDYANEAMGGLVVSHSWASGAYTDVVKAMRAYAAACVREDREKVMAELRRNELDREAALLALPVETP